MEPRDFITSAMNPDNAPKLSPALRAAHAILKMGDAQLLVVRNAMIEAGPIAKGTANNMIAILRKAGMIEVTGRYSNRKGDLRRIRMLDWPEA